MSVVPVVPAPQVLRAVGSAGSFGAAEPHGTAGTIAVHLPEGADPGVLAWFADRVGGAVRRVDAAQDADLVVALDDAVTLGLDHLPEARGVDPRGVPVDERHRVVADGGRVRIEAVDPAGVARALATVAQLLDGGDLPGALPGALVEDGPAFAWRGLSLDVVRHFSTAEEVLRVIDLLAALKMSVLHLHLTDAQGWRLPVPGRPRLTEGTGPAYTPDDLARILAHAAQRHVTVVPEVDLPGHSAAAVAAYPELATPAGYAHPGAAYLDPEVDAVLPFARDVLDALVAAAPGPFVHLGADEAFGMPEDRYERFVRAAHGHLRSRGKRVVMWQEAVRADAAGPDDVVQYWIGPDNPFDTPALKARAPEAIHGLIDQAEALFARAPGDLPVAAAAGVPVLLSSNTMLYLDRPYAEPAADHAGEQRRARLGMPDAEARTLARTFDWHPDTLPELAGVEVAGIEAAIWCETVTSFEDLTFLLLPRLAGAAERAWTVRATTWEDHAARLPAAARLWAGLGFTTAFVPAPGPR